MILGSCPQDDFSLLLFSTHWENAFSSGNESREQLLEERNIDAWYPLIYFNLCRLFSLNRAWILL